MSRALLRTVLYDLTKVYKRKQEADARQSGTSNKGVGYVSTGTSRIWFVARVTLEESVNHIVGMGLHWDAKRCWPAWCMHRICTAALTPCYDVIAAAAGRGYAVSKLVKI